jgi:hypothetical protein
VVARKGTTEVLVTGPTPEEKIQSLVAAIVSAL